MEDNHKKITPSCDVVYKAENGYKGVHYNHQVKEGYESPIIVPPEY